MRCTAVLFYIGTVPIDLYVPYVLVDCLEIRHAEGDHSGHGEALLDRDVACGPGYP